MANAGKGFDYLLQALGAGGGNLGASMQRHSAQKLAEQQRVAGEERAFARLLEQAKMKAEIGGEDWSTPFEGEVEGKKGLWQYNKRTRETLPVTPGAKLGGTLAPPPKDTIPPTPAPQITKPVSARPRQLVKNKAGLMVSVDPETGTDAQGKSVEGFTPPQQPGLVAVEAPDGKGGTKLVLAPKKVGQEVPGQQTRAASGLKEKISVNRSQLSVIDDALRELETHPDAVGLTRGLPVIGDRLDPRADPEGVGARAQIANIGSLKVHDRSGAAVSVYEFPRLAPFVPLLSDPPAAIRTKMKKLKEALEIETQLLEQSGTSAPGVPGAPSTTKPSLGERVKQLKAEGLSKDAAKAKLRAEGYEIP